jgi:hypothetical protein
MRQFDLSIYRFSMGNTNRVAASALGNKYITTATIYKEGKFHPLAQFWKVLIRPVGFSQVWT